MTEKLKPLEDWLQRWGNELPSAAIVDWNQCVSRIPQSRSRPGSLTREEAFEIAAHVLFAHFYYEDPKNYEEALGDYRRAFGLEESK